MTGEVFLFLGSVLTSLWGVAHLFPTRSVVSGFGDISPDNRRIITMEWIIEGVALIFVGVLVSMVTIIDSGSPVARAVYIASSIFLVVLALISLFTGFRVDFLPYKLCPLIFGTSAVLILAGAFM
jgi:predicted RND superfamily exporter protein